ncbi:MAG: SnoaL-like domain [Verrucomicrobiota bacterium]|jgi:hypothetical protein
MKWIARLSALAILAAITWWIWATFFPGPETVIRKRLNKVATLNTFDAKEGLIPRVANVQELMTYFAPEIEVVVDTPAQSRQAISGRDDLQQAVLGVRSMLRGLNVEFLDTQVTLSADQSNATVSLTAKARAPGDRDFFVQELKFLLRKINGEWLIVRIETVRTLT